LNGFNSPAGTSAGAFSPFAFVFFVLVTFSALGSSPAATGGGISGVSDRGGVSTVAAVSIAFVAIGDGSVAIDSGFKSFGNTAG